MSHTTRSDSMPPSAHTPQSTKPHSSGPRPPVCTVSLTRDFGTIRALDSVTFQLEAQRIGAIVGPNGSGKSTLMRLLSGLLRPTQGHVSVLDLDPFAEAERLQGRVATLLHPHERSGNIAVRESLQTPGEMPLESARPELEPPSPASAFEIQARNARIDELLYRFDLWPQRYQRVADLSASERAKLALVAALAHPVELLLLDEPLAPLDSDQRLQMLSCLRTLAHTDGTTVLFSTHALEDAEAIADDILILRQGHLVAHGTRESLLAESLGPSLEVRGRGFTQEVVELLQRRPEIAGVQHLADRLHIHCNRMCDTAPLVTLLVEAGADIDEVYKRHSGLSTRYRQLLDMPASS